MRKREFDGARPRVLYVTRRRWKPAPPSQCRAAFALVGKAGHQQDGDIGKPRSNSERQTLDEMTGLDSVPERLR